MRTIVALALKDIRLLLRDRAGLFFTLMFPILYAVLFGAMMQGAFSGKGRGRLDVAIADEDRTPASTALVKAFESNAGLDVAAAESGDQARDLVRTRKAVAAIVIPPGYGSAAATPFWGEPARLEVSLDPSRQAEAGMLQGIVMQEAYARFQSVFTDPAMMRSTASEALKSLDAAPDEEKGRFAPLRQFLDSVDDLYASDLMTGANGSPSVQPQFEPVRVEIKPLERSPGAGPRSSWEVTFPQAVVWAMMSASFGFALSLVVERMQGTLMRLQLAPMPRRNVLLGKALACFIVNFAVVSLVMAVGVLFLGVRPNSLVTLVLAIFCCAFAFVGVMMLISVCGRTQASVSGIGWGAMLILGMIGGAMMPSVFMPAWMRSIGMISPMRWGIEAVEGALWRDLSLAQMLLPCGVLLAVGAVGMTLGMRIFSFGEGGK